MSTGLKALGIIVAGDVLALGISSSEPTPSSVSILKENTNTSSSVVAPKKIQNLIDDVDIKWCQ